jgi:hypothetical protein
LSFQCPKLPKSRVPNRDVVHFPLPKRELSECGVANVTVTFKAGK